MSVPGRECGAVMAKYPQTDGDEGGEGDERVEGPAEGAAHGGGVGCASAHARMAPASRARAGRAGRL